MWAPESAQYACPSHTGHCPRLVLQGCHPDCSNSLIPTSGKALSTSYPRYNSVFALLKKKHKQKEAFEKLQWVSYSFKTDCISRSQAQRMFPVWSFTYAKVMCFSHPPCALPWSSHRQEKFPATLSSADQLLGEVTSYRRLKPLSDLTSLGGKSQAHPPYSLPNTVFTLHISGCGGKPLKSGYLLHSSRAPQRR